MARRRDGLDPITRAAASRTIAELVTSAEAFRASRSVLIYAPMRSEVDPREIVAAALERGAAVAFPQVDWDGHLLVPVRLRSLGDLLPGRYGVPAMPGDRVEPVPPCEIDLVLVPGVAFDRDGYRLGYGGGFYDRLLPSLSSRCRRWGLAFSSQVVGPLPHEAHDCRMHAVITEDGWIDTETCCG